MEAVIGNNDSFLFLGSKITMDGDCSHDIRRQFLLGRKAMTNLDSMLKSRDITLPTKVHRVKAMVFPVVSHPEPDILESEIMLALGSTAVNKASGYDGIPGELFKTLKDDAIKVLHSTCQQI